MKVNLKMMKKPEHDGKFVVPRKRTKRQKPVYVENRNAKRPTARPLKNHDAPIPVQSPDEEEVQSHPGEDKKSRR